jgi:hypothetical protein
MNTFSGASCALTALLLLAGGACHGAVPLIKLAPSTGDAVEQLADSAAPAEAGPGAVASSAAIALPDAADPVDVDHRWLGAGSFSLYAGGAFSALAGVAAVMPSSARTRYGVLLAARPLPAFGPVLLLVLGCFVYLGRRRRQSFSLRPARGLLARSGHALARG